MTPQEISTWYVDRIRLAAKLRNEIPGVDRLPLEERLGAFCFIVFDVFEEHEPFVERTFLPHAARWGSAFRAEAGQEILGLLRAPDVPGVNLLLLDSAPAHFVLVEGFVQTIVWWLEDDSEDRQRSTALVDRLVSFMSAVATDPVLDRGVNLVRYAVEAGYLPDVTRIFSWFGSQKSDDTLE